MIGNQLGVLGRALRCAQAAVGHLGLQRLPGLLGLAPGAGIGAADLGGLETGVHLVQRLANGVAHGRAARAQLGVAAEHAGRQAPVYLHQLHQLVQGKQGGGAGHFTPRRGNVVQRSADVQKSGQGAHRQSDQAQDDEFLKKTEAVKQRHDQGPTRKTQNPLQPVQCAGAVQWLDCRVARFSRAMFSSGRGVPGGSMRFPAASAWCRFRVLTRRFWQPGCALRPPPPQSPGPLRRPARPQWRR